MPSDSPRSKPKGFPSTSRPSTSTYICLIACNQQLQHRSTPTPCSSPLSRQVQYRSTLTSCSHASSTLSRQLQYRSTPTSCSHASSPLSRQLLYRQLQQHVHLPDCLQQKVTIPHLPDCPQQTVTIPHLTAYGKQSQYHI